MDTRSSWVDLEFESLRLGDKRLNDRARWIVASAMRSCDGHVSSIDETRAGRDATFRFVENPRVDQGALMEAAATAAIRRHGKGPLFVVLDQTSLAFKDPHRVRGLGAASNKKSDAVLRSVQVMNAIGLNEAGEVLGLLAQEWWTRSDEFVPAGWRPFHERESRYWLEAMLSVTRRVRAQRPEQQIVFVMDRGADNYGVLCAARELGVDVLIRQVHDRKTTTGKTSQLLTAAAPIGRVTRTINEKNENGTVRRFRDVHFQLEAASVELRLNEGERGTMKINVVRMRSLFLRKKKISWVLLTTLPAASRAAALRIVDRYRDRWKIEEFHRTWKKGGCDVERTQLRSISAILRWATMLAIVAARVERLKTLSRSDPDLQATCELSTDEIRALQLISGEKKHWPADWSKLTLGQATDLIGFLGGWNGRSQGALGSVRLARGLQRLEDAADVVRRLREQISG